MTALITSRLNAAVNFLRQGRFAEAAVICRELMASHPRDVATIQLLAIIEAQRGNEKESLSLFAKAINLSPKLPSLYSNRSSVLFSLGRYNEAKKDAIHAISLKSDFSEAYFNQANALRALKDFDQAVTAYGVAIKLNPQYAKAMVGRGLALMSLARHAEAIKDFQDALAIIPSFVEAITNLAAALYSDEIGRAHV